MRYINDKTEHCDLYVRPSVWEEPVSERAWVSETLWTIQHSTSLLRLISVKCKVKLYAVDIYSGGSPTKIKSKSHKIEEFTISHYYVAVKLKQHPSVPISGPGHCGNDGSVGSAVCQTLLPQLSYGDGFVGQDNSTLLKHDI